MLILNRIRDRDTSIEPASTHYSWLFWPRDRREIPSPVSNNAVTPLAPKLIREHTVLHIAADLPPQSDTVTLAQSEILHWAQKRSGGRLPANAMLGEAFEHLTAGRSTSALKLDLPQIKAWALRQEDPDKQVPGRIWTTEAIVWQTTERSARFAARLMVGSGEKELNIVHAAPGYVRQLAESIGLSSAGRPILAAPWYVSDETGHDELIDLLVDPARRLPVVVVSATGRDLSDVVLDLESLGSGLCGLAYVATVSPETSWALTDRVGKRLSVFDGGVRIYMPGFDDDADPFAHPLWIGERLHGPDAAAIVDRQVRSRIALFSTRAVRLGTDIIPFTQLRSASRQAEQEVLAARGGSESEMLSAAASRIAALTDELSEAKNLETDALNEAEKALIRAEEAEARERNTVARIQVLLQRLADVGGGEPICELPTSWSDMEGWTSAELAGRVVLTGAARRGCKKALYADVAMAARCLLWLATTCRDRFLNGGGSIRDEVVEEGIRNSLCGSDEFAFDWQGERLLANWHLKNGGNTRSPENCLRIYYAWDYQTQQVVVADMPAHRHSGAT